MPKHEGSDQGDNVLADLLWLERFAKKMINNYYTVSPEEAWEILERTWNVKNHFQNEVAVAQPRRGG